MRLFGELLGALKAEAGTRVQYTVVGGRGGYFQNVRAIDELSDTAVVFRGKDGSLRVEGEGLVLEKYYAGDVALGGEIVRVERIGKPRRGASKGALSSGVGVSSKGASSSDAGASSSGAGARGGGKR